MHCLRKILEKGKKIMKKEKIFLKKGKFFLENTYRDMKKGKKIFEKKKTMQPKTSLQAPLEEQRVTFPEMSI